MGIGASFRALREDVDQLQMEDLKAQLRVNKGYAQFDKALRSAEARLPLDIVQSWRVPSVHSADFLADAPCAVCYFPLWEDGQETAVPPYNHAFHFDCLSKWLHGHTTCPNCRRELAGEAITDRPEIDESAERDM